MKYFNINKLVFLSPLGFLPFIYLVFFQPDWKEVMDPIANAIHHYILIPTSIIIIAIVINLIVIKPVYSKLKLFITCTIISILLSLIILIITYYKIKYFDDFLKIYILYTTIPATFISGYIIYFIKRIKTTISTLRTT